MSNSDPTTDATTASDEADDVERSVLETRIELLEEENRRLREEYARAKRVEYRRSAVAFLGVGVAAFALGLVFADARTVLFALGGTGVFAGVLTYYLTPEHVIPASVGQQTFDALAANEADVVAELGLTDRRYYTPVPDADSRTRLFVPQHEDAARPAADALRDVFVTPEDDRGRGVSLRASGDRLFDAYERELATALADDPETLGTQLVDGLANQFELLTGGDADHVADGRLVVAVDGVEFGRVDTFDHPVVSFLAVGVATQLDTPVEARVEQGERADGRVILEWPAFDGA